MKPGEFLATGLGWIAKQLPAYLQHARTRTGTNDTVVLAFVPEDNESVNLYSVTREQAIEIVSTLLPAAHTVLKRLREPQTDVTRIRVVVSHKDRVFTFTDAIPFGTEGVLN
jgi:hypothetical protein